MSAYIKNNIAIREIFTEKPNLEDVFVKIVNQNTSRSSLKDLIDEINAEDNSSAESADSDGKEEI